MKKLLAIAAIVCTLIATTMASSACMWFYYQPEEPASLKDR